MYARVLTFLFIIISWQLAFCCTAKEESIQSKNDEGFLSIFGDTLEFKIGEYIRYFTRWLEKLNDRHLGASAFGRLLHYNQIKPKLDTESARSKTESSSTSSGRMKKLSMAMMPLVFHVGATSTWMVLTSLMAVKSVAIGLLLLVFKIAVSSAKLASFFTLLKGKHDEHHHSWAWSPPHHEHHGHERSLTKRIDHHLEHHSASTSHETSGWNSYTPEWTPNDVQDYHTIPSSHNDISYKHKDTDTGAYLGPYLPAEDRTKKADKKFS